MGNSNNSIYRGRNSNFGGSDSDNAKKVVIEYPNGDVYEGELV